VKDARQHPGRGVAGDVNATDGDLLTIRPDLDHLSVADAPLEQGQRHRILERGADDALERSRAVDGVVAEPCQEVLPVIGDVQHEVTLLETTAQTLELHVDDGTQVLLPEAVEDHGLLAEPLGRPAKYN
jgi:hypothetical protein